MLLCHLWYVRIIYTLRFCVFFCSVISFCLCVVSKLPKAQIHNCPISQDNYIYCDRIMTMKNMAQEKNKNWESKLNSIEELESMGHRLDLRIEAIEDVSILAEPVKAGNLWLPNSLCVHPMEGADGDADGKPGELTLRRYKRFVAGGAGLIWVEAIAVMPEGRANPRQLWLNEKNKAAFAEMISMIRDTAVESMGANHNPVIVAQLTHSGRCSNPSGKAEPLVAVRDPYRDAMLPEPEPDSKRASRIPDDITVLTDEYLDKLQEYFVEAARIAFDVGFDAVDIKSCHGYLINELLAAHTREGKYGGTFENRTRFLLEVIDRIHDELGQDKPVSPRLGVYDAVPYPYGWGVSKDDYKKPDLTEPIKLVGMLAERGVKMINITAANPYYNPHINRPFDKPIINGYSQPEHPLAGVKRLVDLAGEIQIKFPGIAIVGTGYSWLRQLMPNVAAAYKTSKRLKIVGAGRLAFAYPDFAKDIIMNGKLDPKKVCICCSACSQLMRDGQVTGCVVRDKEIYGPIFKQARQNK
jgi:2,4-dienoyl-CoA reductase-like NADH-dependent reductase (Old Yellow Enzyme family)